MVLAMRSNRTILVLKYIINVENVNAYARSNRTILVLKFY